MNRHAKAAIERAREEMGKGWTMLSTEMQCRLAEGHLLSIVAGWDDSTTDVLAKLVAAKMDVVKFFNK